MGGWDTYDLVARSRALHSERSELANLVASIPHIEQLTRDAKDAAAIHAVQRLAKHFDMVLDSLEQSKAITNAGYAIEWAAGLKAIQPVAVKAELPIFMLSAVDTLKLKAFLLVALNRVRDYLDLDELSTKAGHRSTALALAVLDDTFSSDSDERAPLATQLVRRLAKPRPRIRPVGSPAAKPPAPQRWAEMAVTATALSSQILLGPEPRGPVVPSDIEGWPFDALVLAIAEGDLVDWQQMASVVQRKPWGEFARNAGPAAEAAGDDAVASALHEVVEFSRALRERREREEIAKRITRTVMSTGLTQKALASRIGTSASRLSTYMSGSVTPSASMLLRIEAQQAEIDEERKNGLL